MIEVTFAYLLATALLCTWKSTRWIGAICLFVVLTIAPVLSSMVLVLVAVAAYYIYGKPRSDVWPRKFPRRD